MRQKNTFLSSSNLALSQCYIWAACHVRLQFKCSGSSYLHSKEEHAYVHLEWYQKTSPNFPRNIHIEILSKQILHDQLPNSSKLLFDIFQRKLHIIWFKGYHAVFKNFPTKFSFPRKYPHRILSDQILHYQHPNSGILLFDIFQRKLIASGSRAITPYSKITQRNFHVPRNIT